MLSKTASTGDKSLDICLNENWQICLAMTPKMTLKYRFKVMTIEPLTKNYRDHMPDKWHDKKLLSTNCQYRLQKFAYLQLLKVIERNV